MKLFLLCLLSRHLLTVSLSKETRFYDGVIEMPPNKDVNRNTWDLHVPITNESSTDKMPMNDTGSENDTRSVPNHFPHQDNWDLQHIIYKFDTQCQRDTVKTMDSYCHNLFTKLKHGIKTRLELPDLHRRQMNKQVLCVSTSPLAFDWYDPTQDLCCNGIHQKVTGKEICCGTEKYNGFDSRAIFDKTQYLCCDGVAYNKTKPYDTCCGRYVYDNRSTITCCNGVLYDPRRKFCCNGISLHHNIGRQNKNGRCCGVEKFDDRCFSCSNDTEIRPSFNPVFQRCCHGRIKKIEGNKTVCCGKQLMDANTHQCIENTIVMKDREVAAKQNGSQHVPNTTEETYTKRPNSNEETNQEATVFDPNGGPYWPVMIIVVGVLAIFLEICIYKRKSIKRFLNFRQPELSHTSISFNRTSISFKNDIEIIPVPMNKRNSIVDECWCESGYESGYNSQAHSLGSELCIIDCMKDETESQDDQAIEQMGGFEVSEDLIDIPYISFRCEKLQTNKDTNLTSELFSNAETQTPGPKESNQRDVFGNVYQHSQYLDKFNRTVQWDKSDSKMTLPASVLTLHKLFVQASSFHDIPTIYKKFRLTADDRLASPVVEYCFTGCKSLNEHALVELPILNGGTEVYKFQSNDGIKQYAELESVQVLEEEDFLIDTFCILKKEKALIYTTKFSGFFCVNHGLSQNFHLKAFLFASYKTVMQNPEVRLNLYIADELHDFTDYNQRMFSNEQCEGREKHAEKTLDLPECLRGEPFCGDDYLEITAAMQSGLGDTWEHKLHPKENRPIEKELKIVKLQNLSKCCQCKNSLPHQAAWCFINKSCVTPSDVVQVVVDVTCKLTDQRAESTRTSLYIDELKIRESDRTEVLSDSQRVSSLKQFLTQFIEPLKREAFLAKLNEYVRRLDPRVALSDNLMDILKEMEKVLHPTDFVRAISDILHQMKEFVILDYLVNNKVIPGHLLQKPVQPQKQNIESRPQATGGASNIQYPGSFPFSNAVSAVGNIFQGDCRPEMETINTCSFDNNNEGAVGHNAVISRPRPELRNTDINESSISGIQHVADTTVTFIETEPISSELLISDSDSELN